MFHITPLVYMFYNHINPEHCSFKIKSELALGIHIFRLLLCYNLNLCRMWSMVKNLIGPLVLDHCKILLAISGLLKDMD